MSSTILLKNVVGSLLDKIEPLLSENKIEIDDTSHFFYVFKKYPNNLSRSELNKWRTLQQEVLSPFKESKIYRFDSKLGIHLWYTKSDYNGIPETALQKPLNNGEHVVKSIHFAYRQHWQDGILASCIALHESPENACKINTSVSGWAIQKRAKKVLTAPLTWFKAVLLLLILFTITMTSAWLTHYYQLTSITAENEVLADAVSPKLLKREKLVNAIQTLETVGDWQNEFFELPVALGMAINELNSSSNIKINRWQWQNKMLIIEFSSEDTDITRLVERTQQIENVDGANIKPHNDEDTWLLEIQWN
ncbi:hypothetical protein [Agaribacter flavus]|uniref:GspL cytoplasmic actin-ATPase-like domain-containing protein n=1 Tax=Agaribacter flavus TaxID=1902781 RepID=A0ABV7FNR9_9ALTE